MEIMRNLATSLDKWPLWKDLFCSFLAGIFGFLLVLLLSGAMRRGRGQNKGTNVSSILYISGIGTQWPSTVIDADAFEDWVRQNYDANRPGIQKVLYVNKKTGIRTRHLIAPTEANWQKLAIAPTFDQIDCTFREHATRLSVSACSHAIQEWGGQIKDITHTVAVTCTNAGSPGYDLEVVESLGLSLSVHRTLVHGVGCAGGLAALRTAEYIAKASDEPANVLIFACEITSIHACPELDSAAADSDASIGSVLFSDGAAALILSNESGQTQSSSVPIYKLLHSTSMRVPNTRSLMSYYGTQHGFRLSLSREIPAESVRSLWPAFRRMIGALRSESGSQDTRSLNSDLKPSDFDWALHPGGISVIKGAETALELSTDHLRASFDVYRTHGNSSSVAVLAVLDRLRRLGLGRDHIIAASFGPGLTVEMVALARCR